MTMAQANQTVEDEYSDLANNQRLKAAVYYTVLQICRQVETDTGTKINKQVAACISELTCKQFETVSTDLELFARHAKRTTINTDDVKLVVRKTPKLLEHLNEIQESKPTSNKGKKKSTNKIKKASTVIIDEDSRDMDVDS